MKVADGVKMLKISANMMGAIKIVYPALLGDNHTVILVDAGFPGQLPLIRQAMEKAGTPFSRLNLVIITHHDLDHTGSLAAILNEKSEKIQVIAHNKEKPFIQGEQPPVKMNQLATQLSALPEEQKNFYLNLNANYKKYSARVDQTVTDGEVLPYCGGITIIQTPGHTPGHICLYHRRSKTLISGDALRVEEGVLIPAPRYINFDHDLAVKSLKKLTRYDIEAVICYHGGLYREHPNRRLAALARA